MGSARLACFCLRALLKDERIEVVGAFTQPDRRKGRGLAKSPCPVKETALEEGVEVFTPVNVNSDDSVAALRELKPDLLAVVAYGRILKSPVLDLPPLGCVNIHASLLPKYRGAAPIQWAIANGEQVTGVTSMFMNECMDEGDIILQETETIRPEDNASTLGERLAEKGGALLVRTLELVKDGNVRAIPQDEAMATFAPKLRKDDGRINWSRPAVEIYNLVRGFYPWPCCFCELPSGETLKVIKAEALRLTGEGEPAAGEIADAGKAGLVVGTGKGMLKLVKVQPSGGKVMTGEEYARGHSLKAGEKLA